MSTSHNIDYNHNLAKLGCNGYKPSSTRSSSGSTSTSALSIHEPMDLSNAKSSRKDEAEIQVADNSVSSVTAIRAEELITYVKDGHTHTGRIPANNQNSITSLKTSSLSRCGCHTGDELGSEVHQIGKRVLASQSSVLYHTERVCKSVLPVVEAIVNGFAKP